MEPDHSQIFPLPPSQPLHGTKRPRRVHQSSTPLAEGECASPSPLLPGQTQVTPEVLDHIYGLKHLDDQQIFDLLRAARYRDRSSVSTFDSRASSYLSAPSRVPSVFSDPRDSVASTDTCYTSFSASSRFSQAPTLASAPPKNFECTFCDTSLKSKSYWKSHEEEFHEQARKWKCPDCEQWFNAGKRFREHHYKRHACENCKQSKENGHGNTRKASPCVKKVEQIMHRKNAWGCGFCAKLLTSWEERCEHIAMHFEEGKSKSEWEFTNVILGLLQQPDVSLAWNRLVSKQHGELRQNWPQFAWDSKKSHRLRFSLEEQWNTRVFNVDKLIEEVYKLGVPPPASPAVQKIEMAEVDVKGTPGPITTDLSMRMSMDIDPVKASRAMSSHIASSQSGSSQTVHEPQWAIPSQPASKSAGTDHGMSSSNFMDDAFSQSLPNDFHTGPLFNDICFNAHDIETFDHIGAYMDYTANHVEHPTQFGPNIGFPKSDPPSCFAAPSQSPPLSNSHQFKPRLVSIPSRRDLSQDKALPPPPMKDQGFTQFGTRRRPDIPSQNGLG